MWLVYKVLRQRLRKARGGDLLQYVHVYCREIEGIEIAESSLVADLVPPTPGKDCRFDLDSQRSRTALLQLLPSEAITRAFGTNGRVGRAERETKSSFTVDRAPCLAEGAAVSSKLSLAFSQN